MVLFGKTFRVFQYLELIAPESDVSKIMRSALGWFRKKNMCPMFLAVPGIQLEEALQTKNQFVSYTITQKDVEKAKYHFGTSFGIRLLVAQ